MTDKQLGNSICRSAAKQSIESNREEERKKNDCNFTTAKCLLKYQTNVNCIALQRWEKSKENQLVRRDIECTQSFILHSPYQLNKFPFLSGQFFFWLVAFAIHFPFFSANDSLYPSSPFLLCGYFSSLNY